MPVPPRHNQALVKFTHNPTSWIHLLTCLKPYTTFRLLFERF